MAKIGVVIHTNLRKKILSAEDAERLSSLGEVVWTDSAEKIDEAEGARLLADCDIAVGSWGTPYPTAALMASAPKLRMWMHVAGTVSHFFGPHLEGRDITVASCKPANGFNVAEMVLAEIILGARRAFENMEANRAGRAPGPPNLKVLYESTVGVVGASVIGRQVVELLRPFGPKVLLYDPFVSSEEAERLGVELMADKVELCRLSDVVTLHTPNVPACEGIIGQPEFAAMKDDCVFINSARGKCVDEAAMIRELQKGRLFAILDVTYPEPPADDSPLRTLPNCRYTSHVGGPPAMNLGRQAVDDIEAFLSGGRPQCVVTAEQIAHCA